MEIELKEILIYLKPYIISIEGNYTDHLIKHLKAPNEVDEYTLDWISPLREDKQKIAENSKAKVILVDKTIEYSKKILKQRKVLIFVEKPRRIIGMVGLRFFTPKLIPQIHESAIIHPNAIIGKNVYIGPNVIIGDCIIGDNSIILANIYLYDKVKIGKNVIIKPGSVIGVEGLGCERDSEGQLHTFPHLGGVLISDNVEIGANCQVARGALSDTIIGKGTKINGLCFIAHNCILGDNIWITGDTMLAGSCKIGKNTTIYSKVIVREQLNIGENVSIGMGSVVTKDIPNGETWIGSPAKRKTE